MGLLYIKWWLEYIFRHYSERKKSSGFWELVDDILWHAESALWDIIDLIKNLG